MEIELNLPIQLLGEIDPLLAVECKPGQSRHLVCPILAWYVPFWQGRQGSTPFEEKVPAAQVPYKWNTKGIKRYQNAFLFFLKEKLVWIQKNLF